MPPNRLRPALFAPLLLLVLWTFAAMGGCGYNFVSQGKVDLPDDIRTLAIKKVANPSMETWLPAELISQFRDEITDRAQLAWVDKSDADGLVYIEVKFFDIGTSVSDDKGRTEQYSVSLNVRARIRRRLDNVEVWDSGSINMVEYYLASDRNDARRKAVELAVRRMVDALQNAY